MNTTISRRPPTFSLCVYCGSRPGSTQAFADLAQRVGTWIGHNCGGQVISDSLISFFVVDSRSKALGDKLPSFE
jgi:predicted Rossmann-fold nucleotide-binding protein